jgi:ABC-type Zn uptake system ZnuABC Zn-binding protein ZnuA/ABC-type Mn2+/Zn2+ transport system permease subunit
VLDPFDLAFVQRGLLEVLVLSVGAGLLGTWIVLRGLAFFTHAVAAATFPGLVVAAGLGFAAPLGAAGVAALFAAGVGRLSARQRSGYDSQTAIVLVGALALGIILASDVFHSGSGVENQLFGSLLVVGTRDILVAGALSLLALLATLSAGPRWLAAGFDRESADAMGLRSTAGDLLLLGMVAFAAVASLTAIGSLLAAALLVVPAATTRLWTSRLPSWQVSAVLLTAAEGTAGLWLSVKANIPPGAAIAVLSGGIFLVAAVARALPRGSRRPLAAAAAALLALALAGCGASAGSSGGRVAVVATTTQIGDFVRAVGGRDISLHQILQPNTDPHEYEPRPKDVTATAGARLVFVNGDNLDRWMSKVVDEAGGHPRVVDLGRDAVARLPGESSGPEASKFDPHWWHDPRNAQAAVQAIRDALTRADPAHRAAYQANATRYLARLHALDAGIQRCFAAIPAGQRKLVTSHDGFNYFARRYGVRVVGAIIPSQTTQAQPSAGDVAALSDQVRREHVRAIFLESSINPKLAEGVARQTGAIGSLTLYGDTLGPPGSSGATYLTMEAHNADAMVRGFTGGSSGCSIRGL